MNLVRQPFDLETRNATSLAWELVKVQQAAAFLVMVHIKKAHNSARSIMTLTIIYDSWTEGHAIYIDGMLRANFDEGEFDSAGLMECYDQFAAGEAVTLERIEVLTSRSGLGIYNDVDGTVDWPEQLGELLADVA